MSHITFRILCKSLEGGPERVWGLMILHLAYSACQVPSSCAALYWSFVQHSANLVFSCDHCVPGILVSIEIAWSLPQYICGVKNEGLRATAGLVKSASGA